MKNKLVIKEIEMRNPLVLKIEGLKCDNPNCDFKDTSVDVGDYENWVNAKCPKCGEILLTEADYLNTKFLLGIVELAKEIFPKSNDDDVTVISSVSMDGSGSMKFHLKNE